LNYGTFLGGIDQAFQFIQVYSGQGILAVFMGVVWKNN
jgi:hypothetical protein